MKHILVLGAKGTLGQALVEVLSASYKVTGYDRSDLDITSNGAVMEKVTTFKPDVIINAVAINVVDDIETDDQLFELAKEVNGYAVGRLAKLCKTLSIPLVHVSTDYVFDGENTEGYTEDASTQPISRYAETKLLGETEVLANTDAYYIVRISRLFGKKGSSESSKRSFVDLMLALAETKDHLDIVSDQFSCPSYAPDVATFIQKLLEEEQPFGIYHGANSGACSWYEWAEEVFRLKNITIDTARVDADHFPRAAKAPMHSELLSTKMPAQPTWQDALKRYIYGE